MTFHWAQELAELDSWTKAKLGLFPPGTHPLHLAKKLPLSLLKEQSPLACKTGVQRDHDWRSGVWTKAESAQAPPTQQPLHLERYFPLVPLKATWDPTTSRVQAEGEAVRAAESGQAPDPQLVQMLTNWPLSPRRQTEPAGRSMPASWLRLRWMALAVRAKARTTINYPFISLITKICFSLNLTTHITESVREIYKSKNFIIASIILNSDSILKSVLSSYSTLWLLYREHESFNVKIIRNIEALEKFSPSAYKQIIYCLLHRKDQYQFIIQGLEKYLQMIYIFDKMFQGFLEKRSKQYKQHFRLLDLLLER